MTIDINAIYDSLPLSEKTLRKRMRQGQYPELRNDRGAPCDYYIYDGDAPNPVGVVVYYKQRRLVLHGIHDLLDVSWICPNCNANNLDNYEATTFPACEDCGASFYWGDVRTTEQLDRLNRILKKRIEHGTVYVELQ